MSLKTMFYYMLLQKILDIFCRYFLILHANTKKSGLAFKKWYLELIFPWTHIFRHMKYVHIYYFLPGIVRMTFLTSEITVTLQSWVTALDSSDFVHWYIML